MTGMAGQMASGITIKKLSDGRNYTIRDNRSRFFYPEEWMAFYDKLSKSQRHTFRFLINTGARINEARNVTVGDMNLEKKRIVLRVTKVKAAKGEKKPRPREIPVSTEFAKYLMKYLKFYNLNETDYTSILSTPAANIAMKKALQKAGIKDWQMFSVHTVRKSLETWLMALGVDGLSIVAHIGHDLRTASRHYVSPDVFTFEEKSKMRLIIGDLYNRRF